MSLYEAIEAYFFANEEWHLCVLIETVEAIAQKHGLNERL